MKEFFQDKKVFIFAGIAIIAVIIVVWLAASSLKPKEKKAAPVPIAPQQIPSQAPATIPVQPKTAIPPDLKLPANQAQLPAGGEPDSATTAEPITEEEPTDPVKDLMLATPVISGQFEIRFNSDKRVWEITLFADYWQTNQLGNYETQIERSKQAALEYIKQFNVDPAGLNITYKLAP